VPPRPLVVRSIVRSPAASSLVSSLPGHAPTPAPSYMAMVPIRTTVIGGLPELRRSCAGAEHYQSSSQSGDVATHMKSALHRAGRLIKGRGRCSEGKIDGIKLIGKNGYIRWERSPSCIVGVE
jgi:hypothetical protein